MDDARWDGCSNGSRKEGMPLCLGNSGKDWQGHSDESLVSILVREEFEGGHGGQKWKAG